MKEREVIDENKAYRVRIQAGLMAIDQFVPLKGGNGPIQWSTTLAIRKTISIEW